MDAKTSGLSASGSSSWAANPASPEAIAALRAHPRFPDAMRAWASGIVAMYQGGRLLNWLMDDRARLLFGYFALYLHVTRQPDDPSTWLTPTRMKSLCAEFDICSPGRAVAMLSLMRFAGYLAPATDLADRRRRGFVATDSLLALLRARWELHFGALSLMLPVGEAALAALHAPVFVRGLLVAMMARYRAGFRFVTHAPGLGLFGERNGGMLILMSLLTAGEPEDTMPPTRPVPISISALARRVAVSRPHVLKVLRDAADEGFIERSGLDGDRIVILPRLSEASQSFFAAMFLFLADCAREALEGPRDESRVA
jgi:DNA-binding MarR family transcriptional regulator